jgi:ubiquinone/menaquinone biosynthesis C-methylase UbiE
MTRRSKPFYLMESAHEGARLEAKTDALATELQLLQTGLRAGMRALDVGCGTGAVTRVMATMATPGRVTGVDMSAGRLTQARRLASERGLEIEFVEGEAIQLPLPSATFDYTWSRFLFEYLPDPERALAELVRVTRPGGLITVGDLDGQIEQFYPLDPAVEMDLRDGLRLLGETGFDPHTGRKPYHWFYRAGLRDIAVHALPYQVYCGGVPLSDLPNWREKVVNAAAFLGERTGDRARWDRFRDAFLSQILRPDVFYHCTLILVRGRAPSLR